LARAAAVVLLLGLTVVLLHRPILRGVAGALVVEDAAAPVDFVFLLNGRPSARPFHAATLYHRGLAPRVVLAQVSRNPAESLGICDDQTAAALAVLRRLHVPDSAVTVLSTPRGVTSTQEEAHALRAYLQRNPADRILVVTSGYHTRRTRWWLRRELGDMPVRLLMWPVRDTRFDESDWWTTEEGLIAINNEYLTWVHNLLRRTASTR
jgi:uncharacterized SAM-binding protein YcdF (DUF218 family)